MWVYVKENGEILTVSEKDVVASGYARKYEYQGEIPNERLDFYLFDGEKFVKKGEQQIVSILKEEINDLRKSKTSSLLSQTDYVLLKLQEAQIEEDTDKYNALLQQYSGILAQRQAIRQWNDGIEQRIQNATTKDELVTIEAEIDSYTGDANE